MIFLMTLLMLLASCTATGPAAKNTIRLAFVSNLSGDKAADGRSLLRGVQLYLETLNRQGGIAGKHIALEIFDDEERPEKAREIALEIAQRDDIIGVIGNSSSAASIAAGEVYQEYGIPAITPSATNSRITNDNDWYFRTIFRDDFQGKFLAHYVLNALEETAVSIIHEDAPYGLELAENFEKTGREIGLNISFKREFQRKDPDLDTVIRNIVSELKTRGGNELIFLSVHSTEGIKLVKEIRDAGLENQLLVPDDFDSKTFRRGFDGFPSEIANPGYYANGIYVASPMLFDVMEKNASQFFDTYTETYNEEPYWRSAFAYDAAMLFAEAISNSGLSGNRKMIKEDRRKVRDFLANLTSAEAAVSGVTGPNFFDEHGDPAKPISIGVFQNKKIASAFTQYQLIRNPEAFSERTAEYDSQRLISIGDERYYQTSIVFAGTRAEEFTEIDLTDLTFKVDFYLWFRYDADINIEDIEFINAAEPVRLGEPVSLSDKDGVSYRAYLIKGRFKADYVPAPYGQHMLSVHFRHKYLSRHNLKFALDVLGMEQRSDMTPAEQLAFAQRLLNPSSGWMIAGIFFYMDAEKENTLGHPDYIETQRRFVEFSRFNIGARIKRPAFTLRGLITGDQAGSFLMLSGAALLLIFAFSRSNKFLRFSRLTWLLQLIFMIILMLALETVLGSRMSGEVPGFYLGYLDRVFDILWWFVPAFFLSSAVKHFFWEPLERNTGQTVPTLLVHFVTFTIYLLAFFGVIAFVFDQKLTSLLATSGVIAMIIGLAIQINISNIFSGIALNMERPFRIGDWIMIHERTPHPQDNIIGCIIDIGWRTTRLKTTGNNIIIIPNSSISEKTITNFTLPEPTSRFEQVFYVDYAVPAEKVLTLTMQALNAVAGKENNGPLREPKFKVRVNDTHQLGLEYEIRYYLKPAEVSPAKARHSITTSLMSHLSAAGITPSYPKEVFIDSERLNPKLKSEQNEDS